MPENRSESPQENQNSPDTRQKSVHFLSADLEHYIKKYRLTRPLTEMEAQLLAEQTGVAPGRVYRRRLRPARSDQGMMAVLRTLGMAILVALAALAPLSAFWPAL